MRIFYFGDIVARSGRDVVAQNIADIRQKYNVDVMLLNVENAAHGFGATPGICRDFLDAGVNGLIMGNHTYNQKELIPFLNDCKQIIRPLNFGLQNPGRGAAEILLANGQKLLIVQVQGRQFMEPIDNPIAAIDSVLKSYNLGKNINAILVDMHAEATSEKLALGYYLDGKVSVVAGTHTHVPTADARILPNGTAYITDVGMCGDYNSVLGFDIQAPINRLRRHYTQDRLTPAKGQGTLWGILVETDDKTGLAKTITQIKI
jgi:metallophosphoesterase (TIGR00282 family)